MFICGSSSEISKRQYSLSGKPNSPWYWEMHHQAFDAPSMLLWILVPTIDIFMITWSNFNKVRTKKNKHCPPVVNGGDSS